MNQREEIERYLANLNEGGLRDIATYTLTAWTEQENIPSNIKSVLSFVKDWNKMYPKVTEMDYTIFDSSTEEDGLQ